MSGEPTAELIAPKIEANKVPNLKLKEKDVIRVGSYVNTEAIKNKEKVKLENVRKELEVEIPVVKSIAEFEELISKEDIENIFLRWTPDIKADQLPGAVSRNLLSGTEEAGISVSPVNPYPENGYGLKEGFRFAAHLQQDPELSKAGERRYYLLRGERALDKNGMPAVGDSNEPLLRAETIVPLAEISESAVVEAYLRTLAFSSVKKNAGIYDTRGPGEMMSELRDEMASWEVTRPSAIANNKIALEGVEKYIQRQGELKRAA